MNNFIYDNDCPFIAIRAYLDNEIAIDKYYSTVPDKAYGFTSYEWQVDFLLYMLGGDC